MAGVLSDQQLEDLYAWVDQIPLSRRKKNMPRDFSDAVLMAEVVAHFFPRLVELHNYDQGLRVETKIYNWKTLNQRVLSKIGCPLDKDTINDLANARPGVIESVLWNLRSAINEKKDEEQKPYFDEAPGPDFAAIEAAQTATDRQLLLDKIQEAQEQADYIQALEAKIEKLEELMKLKDAKIAKLTGKSVRSYRQ